MSAYRNPPKGHMYMVFELATDGIKFLLHIPKASHGKKVCIKGRALQRRTTKHEHNLIIYCVPSIESMGDIKSAANEIVRINNLVASELLQSLKKYIGAHASDASRNEIFETIKDKFYAMVEYSQPTVKIEGTVIEVQL